MVSDAVIGLWGLVWQVTDGAVGKQRPKVAEIKHQVEGLVLKPWTSSECSGPEGGLRALLWCLGYEMPEAKTLARELVAAREGAGLMVWEDGQVGK